MPADLNDQAAIDTLLRDTFVNTFRRSAADNYRWLMPAAVNGHRLPVRQLDGSSVVLSRAESIATLHTVQIQYRLETGAMLGRRHLHASISIQHRAQLHVDRDYLDNVFSNAFGSRVYVQVQAQRGIQQQLQNMRMYLRKPDPPRTRAYQNLSPAQQLQPPGAARVTVNAARPVPHPARVRGTRARRVAAPAPVVAAPVVVAPVVAAPAPVVAAPPPAAAAPRRRFGALDRPVDPNIIQPGARRGGRVYRGFFDRSAPGRQVGWDSD